MRVGQLIHGLGLGGAQQVIRSLVAGRADGIEHLVYSCHGGVTAERIEAAGATVRIVPRRWPKLDPFWIRDLARAFEDDAIDVLHGHLFGDSLHGYLAASRIGRTPMVMTLHNVAEARSRLQLTGYRWLLGGDTLPCACADFVRRSFVTRIGSRAETIRTVRNGIEDPRASGDSTSRASAREQLIERFGIRPEALVFVTLGRLAEQKGLDRLLVAIAGLLTQGESCQLLLLGDGPKRQELEEQARALGLDDAQIVFAGFQDDAAALVAGADVLVFSSLWEGLPIALLEGMAHGLAVVSTLAGGVREAIDDEVEGLLVRPDDPVALADALERVAADEPLRNRLGAAARSRFERDFDARHMVSAYEEVYRRVERRRGIPA